MSSKFLTANPETVEAIFKLDKPAVHSELDFVRALESFIKKRKENDSNIAKKVRSSLNCIRFLTLTPMEIAKTTLLTPEEIKAVIICLSSEEDFVKMPDGFSLNKKGRGIYTFS